MCEMREAPAFTGKMVCTQCVLCNIDRLELLMPRYALKGGDVFLKCDHSVRLEHLHKVEWKKGDDKLFMYVKGRTPPFKAWEIPGAKLNSPSLSVYESDFIILIEEVIELCQHLLQNKISKKHFCDHLEITHMGLESNLFARRIENMIFEE
ncbi:unnamed protein product [Ceutorhynchus assimilis]|uniref:Uncharacterized protein n=1 Tax=Ceutorhynchus assimilis TaxID=467358 RepID=A0A9N9MST3_9CUCU|nr:unnamed protein product [Ceutorhynchus assimilis]